MGYTVDNEQSAGGSYAYPDYCNDDCPVLSFLAALYSDAQYSQIAYERWINSEGEDDQYLDNYTRERSRLFPDRARALIHVDVGANPVVPNDHRRVPTQEQARELVRDYVIPELCQPSTSQYQTAAEPEPGRPWKLIPPNPERPLLNWLAKVFVNLESVAGEEPASHGVAARECELLSRTRCAANGRPYLESNDAKALTEPLSKELAGLPPCW